MTKKQALKSLEASLSGNIKNWMDDKDQKDLKNDNAFDKVFDGVCYPTEALHVLMARAAMSCLEASVDVQQTMK